MLMFSSNTDPFRSPAPKDSSNTDPSVVLFCSVFVYPRESSLRVVCDYYTRPSPLIFEFLHRLALAATFEGSVAVQLSESK